MPIQYKTFTLPIKNAEQTEADLNRFLRSARVVHVHREFVSQGEQSCWCMAVEYLSDNEQNEQTNKSRSGKNRIDYREVLSPENFALFVKLRDWRKALASKEAVLKKVPYSMFEMNTDELFFRLFPDFPKLRTILRLNCIVIAHILYSTEFRRYLFWNIYVSYGKKNHIFKCLKTTKTTCSIFHNFNDSV